MFKKSDISKRLIAAHYEWEHRRAKDRLYAMESGKLESTNEEYFSAIFSFYNTRNRRDMEVSRA